MLHSMFWNGEKFWSGLSTKNLPLSLSNLALKKVSECSFTKIVLQYSPGLVQMKWGLEWEYIHPSRFLNGRNFISGFVYEKSTHVVVKFCAQKVSVCSFTKSVLQYSPGLVQIKWGLEWDCMHPSRFLNGMNFYLVGLRIKYSCRCQLLRSKKCRYAVSRIVFFNIVQDLFKWNEG